MIQVLRFHSEIFSVLSDMFQFLVPAQRLPHIERILACFSTSGIVIVIINYPAKDSVSVVVRA